ncbi:MAG: S41 family peptidase [Bacteroidetes bacterium]|nr:S41 family peptidase [Bacteroidota bacterium]
MDKKTNILIPLLLAVCTAGGMLIGSQFGGGSSNAVLSNTQNKKLNQVLDLIEKSYVDTPNQEILIEHAIEEVLGKLDPYSAYVSARDLEHVNAQLQSSFDGIGVEFNIIQDTITVITPISGGPSEKLGILPGDKIVNVEGERVAGVDIENGDVRTKLMGPKGTTVHIEVKRHGKKELIPFAITRDKIPLNSVDASYMVKPGVGYIKVSRFAAKTNEEFDHHLSQLLEDGAENLILDLRGNPGGYLGQAVAMANQFLAKDQLIVYTEGRKRSKEEHKANGTGVFQDGKLIVLIDKGSASASEIVAGAVQDLDRGMIIGQRSHGKGTVQEPVALIDGSSLRLTVARYYTPSGRCIQRDYEDVRNNTHASDSAEHKQYKTTNGRIVADGGGINPDVVVEYDTTFYTPLLEKLITNGLFYQFASEYADAHRSSITSAFETANDFAAYYSFDGELDKVFKAFVSKHFDTEIDSQYQISKPFISTRVRALIGKTLYGENCYYQIVNLNNESFKKALEILSSNEYQAFGLGE